MTSVVNLGIQQPSDFCSNDVVTIDNGRVVVNRITDRGVMQTMVMTRDAVRLIDIPANVIEAEAC